MLTDRFRKNSGCNKLLRIFINTAAVLRSLNRMRHFVLTLSVSQEADKQLYEPNMLHDIAGNRKYLTAEERNRFIEAAHRRPFPINTFCLTLAYSGARISEVLALRAGSVDPAAGIIVFESLKKRRRGVFRQVPVPDTLLAELEGSHALSHMSASAGLWTWSRTTAWKAVKDVMAEAGVPPFCASPKALRHAFGVVGIAEAQVPLNMMMKWLGHSRIETTAIYANAVGSEERAIASRMWQLGSGSLIRVRGLRWPQGRG